METGECKKEHREHVGRLLKNLREKRGLTLRQLSRAVGLDSAYLSRIERGLVPPSERTLRALCLFFRAPEIYTAAGKLLPDDLCMLFFDDALNLWERGYQQEAGGQRRCNICRDGDPYDAYRKVAPKPLPDVYWDFSFEAPSIPQKWVELPPFLRSEVVSLHLKIRSRKRQAWAKGEAEQNGTENSKSASATTAYGEGVIGGLLRAYELFVETYRKYGLFWLLAGFMPAEECRFLAGVYEAAKPAGFSPQTAGAIRAFLHAYTQCVQETKACPERRCPGQ